ncbi:restriction endonuclease [Mesorhizobium sp. L2C066B000]|uniref:restriction endonuclease n=1 Tax=Mesorhizobium sp. L2C066B000 TaxID=1287105 RepID=UPI0003D05E70|nr:restriction endonuclease [Mesorhizobium sp. L2C066B000]ESZ32933.1 hypothetical protein X732_27785 [Mesorhizobium sp. L2C066B000]
METRLSAESIDKLFVLQPCAQDEHFPFCLIKGGDSSGVIFYGAVRLSSSQWDGGGGRTDLHDIFGLMWAAALRATGAASPEVWLDVGWTGTPEIYSRFMFFTQPYSSALSEGESELVGPRLAAHTAWIAHILWEAFHFGPANVVEPRWWDEPKPEWIVGLEDIVPGRSDWIWVTRENPNWEYLVAGDNSVSIVRLDVGAREALDELVPYYGPSSVTFAGHNIYSEHGLVNCVPQATIERGLEILRRVDGNPDSGKSIVIPVDTHCVFIGQRTIVALAGRFDAARYNQLRAEWEHQNAKQSAIFLVGVRWVWSTPLNPARFEALVEAILSEEQGLEWVRAAGPSFERDQGRDLVALWLTPPGLPGGEVHYETAVKRRKIVVQVKSRKKTVGKSDVRDVRDTIERHGADGILVVAHPGWSNDLFNYCEGLAQKGHWVDLWGPSHLEARLRARPYLAERFSDLVRRAE